MKNSREVILRIAAAHHDKRALDILGMEFAYVCHLSMKLIMIVRDFHCAWNHASNVIWTGKSLPKIPFLFNPHLSKICYPNSGHRNGESR